VLKVLWLPCAVPHRCVIRADHGLAGTALHQEDRCAVGEKWYRSPNVYVDQGGGWHVRGFATRADYGLTGTFVHSSKCLAAGGGVVSHSDWHARGVGCMAGEGGPKLTMAWLQCSLLTRQVCSGKRGAAAERLVCVCVGGGRGIAMRADSGMSGPTLHQATVCDPQVKKPNAINSVCCCAALCLRHS
jgi:hypothetical protein